MRFTMIAIDEFHHVSSDESSVLGDALRNIMHNSSAHVLAMTGSYFRGDSAPILTPEDEQQFDKVTYTYYEQLNGYSWLKSLDIGYFFYTGRYVDAVAKVLDPALKTIIHIPSVNSRESLQDKTGSNVSRSLVVTCAIEMDVDLLGETTKTARMCIAVL